MGPLFFFVTGGLGASSRPYLIDDYVISTKEGRDGLSEPDFY